MRKVWDRDSPVIGQFTGDSLSLSGNSIYLINIYTPV